MKEALLAIAAIGLYVAGVYLLVGHLYGWLGAVVARMMLKGVPW